MKWVADSTGRFKYRPHYEAGELDTECEAIVSGFYGDRYSTKTFPISTDDLEVLVENDTSDLDLYADLSSVGEDVEGVTEFFVSRKPAVRIARELSLDEMKRHRLRTTLAHEYGHVKLHAFLWHAKFMENPGNRLWDKISRQRNKFDRIRARFEDRAQDPVVIARLASKSRRPMYACPESGPVCRETEILDALYTDWMEWQASYVSGAILMPITALRRTLANVQGVAGAKCTLFGPEDETTLTARVSETFDVSEAAAKARLEETGFLRC